MTSINLGTGSTAPSQANTLEKLLLWVANQILTIQPVREFNVFSNRLPVKYVDLRIFPTRDYGTRCSVLITLEVESNWKSQNKKFWENIKAITIDGNSPEGASDSFTPGTGGDIPATVTTLGRLAAWCGEALYRCNPTLAVRENDNPNALGIYETIAAASSTVGESDDRSMTLNLVRVSIPVEPTWRSLSIPFYQNAKSLSNVALPDDLKS